MWEASHIKAALAIGFNAPTELCSVVYNQEEYHKGITSKLFLIELRAKS
jgi:hypothetical protein